jgi:HSP90 family molecular chaperone
MNKNNTLEINPRHPIVVKLNALRKRDPKRAGALAQQVMENVLLTSGIPFNLQESSKRNLNLLDDYLQHLTTSGR